jgi:deoxyhypusine synthase
MSNNSGVISQYLENQFKHYNSLSLLNSAKALKNLIDGGGQVMITLAGAFSTGECGITLSQLIRENKIHAISCTGANIEESLFRLLGQSTYRTLPNYIDLTPEEERAFREEGFNRVTDTLIHEEFVMDKLRILLEKAWYKQQELGKNDKEGKLWSDYFYDLFDDGEILTQTDGSLEDCWLYEAWKKKLPIFVAGNVDSTMGNWFSSLLYKKEIEGWVLKHDSAYMNRAVDWFLDNRSNSRKMSCLTLGGGIAADFIQTVSPIVILDMEKDVPAWDQMIVITMDMAVTAGGFSGCSLNEKITWAKLEVESEKFLINSDFTIVFPLLSAYILNQ